MLQIIVSVIGILGVALAYFILAAIGIPFVIGVLLIIGALIMLAKSEKLIGRKIIPRVSTYEYYEADSDKCLANIIEEVGEGKTETLFEFLEQGGSVETIVEFFPTYSSMKTTMPLLMVVAKTGQLEIAKELIKRGARVNAPRIIEELKHDLLSINDEQKARRIEQVIAEIEKYRTKNQ